MNKIWNVVGCAFFLGACGKSETPSKNIPTPSEPAGIKLVAFGDSLTAGKDLEEQERGGFPRGVEALFAAGGGRFRSVALNRSPKRAQRAQRTGENCLWGGLAERSVLRVRSP